MINKCLLGFLFVFHLVGCHHSDELVVEVVSDTVTQKDEGEGDMVEQKWFPLPEPTTPVVAINIKNKPNQTNFYDTLGAIALDYEQAEDFIDIRGVGDAGMAHTHRQPMTLTDAVFPGVQANFGKLLDAFDDTGKSYRADLSFMNWESTLGLSCQQFWAPLGPRSFAFASHPDNMKGIYERGFNLIGLANNHTRDCDRAEEGVDGVFATARHMERLTSELNASWLWHGVGEQKEAVVKTMMIKDTPVKVAFASLYLAYGDCTYTACLKDELTILRSLRDSQADIRILSIHSWTAKTQKQLVDIGVNFVQNFEGDIVFGHGPHRLAPIRIVESPRGKRGVIFESLGNFIHPVLLPIPENIIGRVLFDKETLELRQIQVIPISTDRVYASFNNNFDPTKVIGNVSWQPINDDNWRSGVNSNARGAYTNILQSQK
ncbi:poly-gamma-glutamate synthesis protein (capsule biosynthesis protein) [Cyanobacterium sp. HL-69]|uniref:CapA family protein n=1 Tax=Cyanobacterium sp. HL-69 TaxID=2054282 RepID=UPI000CA0E5C3|nr:poly-gamma-glutamate synthesis protein (capsule biosynthesis protein) [Cyanobacterium sp. HL-69]